MQIKKIEREILMKVSVIESRKIKKKKNCYKTKIINPEMI